MKKGNLLTLTAASLGLLVLILDGKTAVYGIQCGIDICLRTLIPSLFPFFVISAFITSSLLGQAVAPLRMIGRICRIPAGSESLLAVGILGGYPVGAKNVSDARRERLLSAEDAQRMAVFCNNAGPSFLFGILGPLFPNSRWVWLLWAVQILSAILTGMLLPGGSVKSISMEQQKAASITGVLGRSLKSIALVCGWVTLFRMILEFLNRWIFWLFPLPLRVLLTGLLELSNGCIGLHQIGEEALRFLLASVMLSMGGLCILMQTKSVFQELDMKAYLRGKLLQCAISMLLSLAAVPLLTESDSAYRFISLLFVGLTVAVLCQFSRKRKKEVAIQ